MAYEHFPPPLEGQVREVVSSGLLREIVSEALSLIGAREVVELFGAPPVIVDPGGGGVTPTGPLISYDSSTIYDLTTVYASG